MQGQPSQDRDRIELVAGRKSTGLRLDCFLVQAFPDLSRSAIQKIIGEGGVTINNRTARPSHKIRDGDQVRITLPEPTHDRPEPENIPLEILFEDEFLALVNKPPHMVVHPAKGNWSGTLVNALQFRFAELSPLNGEHRAGIVHRLDRDTSGVILIAKDEATHRNLSLQFERRQVFKEYLAIVTGVLDRDSDYIERRIAHHSRDRVKMAVARDDNLDSKDATTYYEVIERFPAHTFCRVHPRTGRTHQIRVHLASVGCPILADKLYSSGDRFRLSDLVPGLDRERDQVLLNRQALHASRLRFTHPSTRKLIDAQAPLPTDFQDALDALRQAPTS